MTVRRIVANIKTESVSEVQAFYSKLFGLETVMNLDWIVTLASGEEALTQISILSEGGAGMPVPDISIEVDDVDALYSKAKEMGCDLVYELTDELWGVRRFFIRDPAGKLINILSHKD